MTLKIYNTLTKQKEDFKTIEPNKVKMYSCGVTVYDYCHLGHARSYITWDVIRSYLQYIGYEVNYVQNFTDVDDKIIQRGKLEGLTMEDISNKYINAYFDDMERLGIKEANTYPKVTEHIPQIIDIVQELISLERAYISNQSVYLDVSKVLDYGKLSGRTLEQLKQGIGRRIGIEDGKRSPLDFVLWKSSKLGEPSWDSPWGKGRPGWHIECSAMVKVLLGETIDIHGGGSDLIFPHHENEIAQSENVTHKPLANYWLHNGMVNIGGDKMSKSLGNFTTIRSLLDSGIDSMTIRLFVLQAHYRKPINFTNESIQSASNSWDVIKEALLFGEGASQLLSHITLTLNSSLIKEFIKAMDNDFNTPLALSTLFRLAKGINKDKNIILHVENHGIELEELFNKWYTLKELCNVLGLIALEQKEKELIPCESYVDELIEQRLEARRNKNFKEGDKIRDYLNSMGVVIVDHKDGSTTWTRN